MSAEIIILCNRVAGRPRPMLGAVQRTCRLCGSAVWASQTTIGMLGGPDPMILQCLACTSREFIRAGVKVQPPTDEQIEEIKGELERRRNQALQ